MSGPPGDPPKQASAPTSGAQLGPMGTRDALLAWLPLAASWLLMACEIPALSAVIARLVNPEIELAAYGSVVFPIALIIEAPIIMLLSASTALSRDRSSYRELRAFANRSGFLLSALHLLIALSPIYDVLVYGALGAPPAVAEAARTGLLVMTPWTWAIASRRFNQGVLIRFGHGRAVTVGTLLRLGTDLSLLGIGWTLGSIPGASLAASAVVTGVTVEAIYVELRVRPVVRAHLSRDDPEHTPLRGREFWRFYVPLALTPIITLFAQPLSSAAVTRMPEVLPSLAVVPVVIALLFMLQSVGLAMSEVVIAGLDRPGSARALWRFTLGLALVVALAVTLMATAPISRLWFGHVSGLSPALVEYAQGAILLGIPTPPVRVLQSWYSGVLVHARQTSAISESVVVFLLIAGVVLSVGIVTAHAAGVYVAVAAISLGRVGQVVWLWWRSRAQVRALLDTQAASP